MSCFRDSFSSVLLFTVLVSSSILIRAEAVDCVVTSSPQQHSSKSELPSCDELYPDYLYQDDSSPWRIGFAAGLGERSNPLINSDDIPIYGIVQLSYFGENFFFDNGDIGWFLLEKDQWSLNAIAGVGGERSFFSFLNTSSVGFAPSDSSLVTSPALGDLEGELVQIEIEIPDRDYTVDGGLEFIYHQGVVDIQLQLLTDLSGRHKGQEAWLALAAPQRWGRWELVPSVGVNWKSSAAASYYYGVEDDEAMPGLPAYDVDAASNVFARLALSYTINQHWKVVSIVQYENLANTITDSPIVEDNSVQTAFVGIYYEF